MEYTQRQKDEIRAYIAKIGVTLNEDGCEVWNSAEHHRSPYFKLPFENGKTQYVNIRTFLWMEGNGGTWVKDTHTSCGNTECIKLGHIVKGRKKISKVFSKTTPVHTENPIMDFIEKIKNGCVLNENGCHIWGGGLLEEKYPFLSYTIRNVDTRNPYRRLYILRFLFIQSHGHYNFYTNTLTKTCKENRCVNIDHVQLVENKKGLDLKRSWELLLKKTRAVDDCLVLEKTGPLGYGNTTLGGVKMGSHCASYIINKNGGKPLPKRDEHGNFMVIRHLCHEQPGCVNPDHLELGTQSTNAYDDRVASGTLPRGKTHSGSKITEELAQEIKNSLWEEGHPQYMTKKRRAEKFGTTRGIVEAIDQNRSWSHLPNQFGVVTPNADLREKSMKRQRVARTIEWNQSEFCRAAEMIKANVVESDEGKAGSFPPGKCWLWLGAKKHGYGIVCFNGRQTGSHQLSLESEHGRFSRKNEVVRHLCDNRPCARPSHLRFGTRKDNAIDLLLYGKSKAHKLDAEKVRMIRQSNASSAELANQLGVHRASVFNVRNGNTWSSVI